MKIIAVYSIKGGVGKTAAAVNLSFYSSNEGARTLLWDLDPQSSASFYLRVKPKVKGGGKGLVKKGREIDAAIKATDFEGFDLLPGDLSYRRLDLLLADVPKATRSIRSVFDRLDDRYDHLVIDCAPGISLIAESLMKLADLVLVPTIPTPLSLRTLDQISRFFRKNSIDGTKVHPFLSMIDRRKSLHRSVADDPPRKPFPFCRSGIPYASVIEKMGIFRCPLPAYSPGSSAGRAFWRLWLEVREMLYPGARLIL